MAGCQGDSGCLYECGYKKRMRKKGNKKCTEFAKKQKISEFFACDKLYSPSVAENSTSAMLDVSREESDLFQQGVNAKAKYEGDDAGRW